MLVTKSEPITPATPDESHENDIILLTKDEERESKDVYIRTRTYYQPSAPLGFKYFEKTFFIFNYGKIPFSIHISLPFYTVMTMIFAILHNQALSWLALILIMLMIQIVCVLIQVLFCVYIANKLNAKIHRILLWPFGSIGYATNYNQWTHFVLIEYAAPFVHVFIFILFWAIARVLGVANWSYTYPINVYFGTNVLNVTWTSNIIIATLHLCIPVYSMKTARVMVKFGIYFIC